MKSSPRSWRFIGPRAACWACKWATDDVDEQKALWQQLATGNWQFDPLRPLSVYVNCTADDSHNSAAQSRCRSQLGERFESEPKPRPRPRPRPRPKSPRLRPVSCQVSLGINKCKTSTPWAQNCYRHRGGYLVRPSVDFDIDIDSDSDTRRNAVRCDVARLDSRLASRNWYRNWSWDWDSLGGHASQNEIVANGSEQRGRETERPRDWRQLPR